MWRVFSLFYDKERGGGDCRMGRRENQQTAARHTQAGRQGRRTRQEGRRPGLATPLPVDVLVPALLPI